MKNRRSALVIAMLGVALASMALAPGIAGAHDVRFDNKVTIKTDPSFHGRVISQRFACESRRRVSVYREQAGSDGLFASTTTDNSGRWELLVSQLTGDFYARIKRKDVGAAGHNHVCKGDRSPSVHVQAPPP